MFGVYLLHFNRPYPGGQFPQHYIGHAWDIPKRLTVHSQGGGSKLVAAAMDKGISVQLVRVWPGRDWHYERALKKRKKSAKCFCSMCLEGRVVEYVGCYEIEYRDDHGIIWPTTNRARFKGCRFDYLDDRSYMLPEGVPQYIARRINALPPRLRIPFPVKALDGLKLAC